jgi:hypothetical protein
VIRTDNLQQRVATAWRRGAVGAGLGRRLNEIICPFMPGEVHTFLRKHLAEAWIWVQE